MKYRIMMKTEYNQKGKVYNDPTPFYVEEFKKGFFGSFKWRKVCDTNGFSINFPALRDAQEFVDVLSKGSPRGVIVIDQVSEISCNP